MAGPVGSDPFPLRSVILRNYRCFGELEWSGIDPQFNVIVAPNARGKTALLDAIAVGLAPFPRTRAKTKGWTIGEWDIRRVAAAGGGMLRASDDVVIAMSGGTSDRAVRWSVTRTPSAEGKTRTGAAVELTESARYAFEQRTQATPLPLVAYYGTSRLWGHQSLTRSRLGREIEDGYLDCLDPRANYRAFEEWVGALSHDRQNEGSGRSARRQWQYLTDVLTETLRPVGLVEFEYSAVDSSLMAREAAGAFLPVQRLSDGTRTLLGLVGDIARRICLLNADLENFDLRATEGIVLVDELDLHLHPAWQQQVVGAVKRAFPKLQWVVTTHSQQVVSTVPRKQVWEFHESEVDIVRLVNPHTQTEGETSSAVLASVFEVDPMPPGPWRDKLMDLDARVKEPDNHELSALLAALQKHFGKDYQALRLWEARRRYATPEVD